MSSAPATASVLKVDALTKRFGGLSAVKELSMDVKAGALYGLIGPNGAGKTTIFNLLTGVYTPTEGSIVFNGKSIAGLKPYEITKLGIARTFQNIRLFADMTVLENVMTAHHIRSRQFLIDAVIGTGRHQREADEPLSRIDRPAWQRQCIQMFPLLRVVIDAAQQRRFQIVKAILHRSLLGRTGRYHCRTYATTNFLNLVLFTLCD